MDPNANKQLMQHIFSELSQGNSAPLYENMADDFTWIVMGTTEWSGTYRGKQSVIDELISPLRSKLSDQYTNTASRFIADGDFVVVECQGLSTTKTGVLYNNNYCFVFRIIDGKLREVTEYMDTQLVATVLGDRKAASA
jgi:hypothetical protein